MDQPQTLRTGRQGGKLSPATIAARKRDAQAVELRGAGYTFSTIAERLGYPNARRAHEGVSRALDRTVSEPAESLRMETVYRLDRMLVAIWPLALGLHESQAATGRIPSLDAIDRVVNIERTRAKLLGLNAREKVSLREVIDRIAEERGYDADEKAAALEYVDNYYRSLNTRN